MRRMLLAVLVAVSLPAVAYAQTPPKPDTYLRLVAAAVAGYSAGGSVYVVICDYGRNQYKIVGVFATPTEASTMANATKTNTITCYVEGPYYNNAVTYQSTDMAGMGYGGGCKKGPDSDCIADSSARAFVAPIGSIESVTITYRLRTGQPVSETFDPRKVEAIFFTMSAVDRMLVPYFVRVYGLNVAVQKRTELLSRYGGRDPNLNQQGPR